MRSVGQRKRERERNKKRNEATALEKFVRSWLLDKFLGKYPFVSLPMYGMYVLLSVLSPCPYLIPAPAASFGDALQVNLSLFSTVSVSFSALFSSVSWIAPRSLCLALCITRAAAAAGHSNKFITKLSLYKKINKC